MIRRPPRSTLFPLHDALPISRISRRIPRSGGGNPDLAEKTGKSGSGVCVEQPTRLAGQRGDRKSTRLNSSHGYISYAVFCLKKKKGSNHRRRGDPSRGAATYR